MTRDNVAAESSRRRKVSGQRGLGHEAGPVVSAVSGCLVIAGGLSFVGVNTFDATQTKVAIPFGHIGIDGVIDEQAGAVIKLLGFDDEVGGVEGVECNRGGAGKADVINRAHLGDDGLLLRQIGVTDRDIRYVVGNESAAR